MGTRSLTVFKDEDGGEIAVLYRQFDGYPSGHGIELRDFLSNKHVVNGFTADDRLAGHFNGMGCLAAAVVAKFKDGTGSFYLHAAGTRDVGEEFVYTIRPGEGVSHGANRFKAAKRIMLEVSDVETELYKGPVEGFDGQRIQKELYTLAASKADA